MATAQSAVVERGLPWNSAPVLNKLRQRLGGSLDDIEDERLQDRLRDLGS